MKASTVAEAAARSRRAPRLSRAAVVAARDLAAEAGGRVLGAGGSAADAAVATAAVLAVVDPANCGIGGFGGFAVLDRGDGRGATQIGFNARVPRDYRAEDDDGKRPGMAVSPPAVVAGLSALHGRFGRLAAPEVWAPAIGFAREGFAVGRDLANALRWAKEKHRGLNSAFRGAFFRGGEPPREGEILVQARLAATLESIAAQGAAAMQSGPVATAISRTVREAGGSLSGDDFRSLDAQVAEAASRRYRGATIWAPDPEQCGASFLFDALGALEDAPLGASRSEQYVDAVAAAHAAAWRNRHAAYRAVSPAPGQTTHLCAADREGMLVSMTFTHGPAWFGSGLLDEDTGIVLNTGARIFSRRMRDGALVAKPYITPVVVHHQDARYAIGAPGGRHIPGIVLQAVVDLVHYNASPERVLGEPRMSADREGNVEAEAGIFAEFPRRVGRRIEASEYFGPAGMISCRGGSATAFRDPRFDGARVHVE